MALPMLDDMLSFVHNLAVKEAAKRAIEIIQKESVSVQFCGWEID